MRLWFKRVGKNKDICLTTHRHDDYLRFGGWLVINFLPSIEFKRTPSEWTLSFSFLIWEFEIEDESHLNMGCKKG